MRHFLLYELGTGRGRQTMVAASAAAALAPFDPAIFGVVEVAEGVSDGSHYVADGAAVAYPPKGASYLTWDSAARQWVDARPDDELSAQARARRNALLLASDWTQGIDSPLNGQKRAAWVAYRSALRDVPTQAGFPRAIDWPVKPT